MDRSRSPIIVFDSNYLMKCIDSFRKRYPVCIIYLTFIFIAHHAYLWMNPCFISMYIAHKKLFNFLSFALNLFWPHYLRLDWTWKIETRSLVWHINTKIAAFAAEIGSAISFQVFSCPVTIFLDYFWYTLVNLISCQNQLQFIVNCFLTWNQFH